MSRLEVAQLDYRIKGVNILKQFSLNMDKGLHLVLGANGAGKSTLLSLLAGDGKATAGEIRLDNKNVQEYSLRELAEKRAVLTQENPFGFPLKVREVCSLGLLPDSSEENILEKLILDFDLQALALRSFNELSGGEKQRVHLARVFCQQTDFIFLDEPLNHLDIQYQYRIMKLLKEYASQGKVIVCVLHDIQMALSFASTVSVLKKGETLFQGELAEDMDKQTLSHALSEAFDIKINVDNKLRVQIESF